MGLNDAYIHIRSHILLMKPTPSVGIAYDLLLSDENREKFLLSPSFPQALVLSVLVLQGNLISLPKLALMRPLPSPPSYANIARNQDMPLTSATCYMGFHLISNSPKTMDTRKLQPMQKLTLVLHKIQRLLMFRQELMVLLLISILNC